jgi:hypothetical protein
MNIKTTKDNSQLDAPVRCQMLTQYLYAAPLGAWQTVITFTPMVEVLFASVLSL